VTEAPDAQSPTGLSTTLLMAGAGMGASLLPLIGERNSFTWLTAVCSLVGLVPWALVAGGVRVPSWLFASIGVSAGVVTVVVADNTGGMFPLMLVLVWLMRTSASMFWPVVTAVAALAAIVASTIDNGAEDSGVVYFIGGLGISWLSGALLRRQETLTAQIEAMRDAQVEQLAASERARIAREVHDVVAHSLTVVMLNLTGARRALATAPERADEALARAEVVGRDSLDSIREVMAVLHDPAPGAPLPHPTIDRIPELVAGFRTAGLVVELDADDVGPVDPTVQLVVYRIVQESLSNVLQHAPGAGAVVSLRRDGQHVDAVIDNSAPTSAPDEHPQRAGLGTRGMAERVRSVGGTFSAGPTPDAGWRVTARLPIPFLTPTHQPQP
jgi:signal transduction histidine kinase